MQIAELNDLTEWIQENGVGPNILGHYKALHKAVNQNAQQNQPQQTFESQREALIELLKKVPLPELSNTQLEMLDRFQMARYLGDSGVRLVEDILFRNQLDAATAANKLAQIINELQSGIQRAEQLRTALEGCFDEPDMEPGEVPIRIIFARDAAIRSLDDLEKWADNWQTIAYGIARAHGHAANEIRVVGAGTGSLFLELATRPEVLVATLALIANWGLEATEKVMEIRKRAAEIRGLEIDNNNKIAKQLDAEAEKVKKNQAKIIVEKLVVKFNIKEKGAGDEEGFLNVSVKRLLDFLDKGGEIDAWMPDEEEQADDAEPQHAKHAKLRNETRAAWEEVRRLENKFKVLPHLPTNTEENDDSTPAAANQDDT